MRETASMMMETVPSGTILHRRYRIERVLGSGGFGHVYLALDLITNQQYALKEYFVTGSSGQAQLQHEAKVLSQLHHPNLPAFHEAFNERGHYFVVLSYIEGNDLTDLIRVARRSNEPIPLARVMGWILSVCDAVQFLHSQQPVVIHRDIKPDNIRIMPDGTAILVDLGNAKATADGARTLFFIRHQGTPGYAPQEQYPGGTGTDVRSDVYALGGTLYFALTAHEPPSVSTRNQSIQQGLPDLPSLQEQLANNPPEESAEANAARQFRLGVSKPSKPSPRHLRHLAQLGALPPELLNQLNQLIHHAMQMKPRDRYQSVADFAADLKKIIAALPRPAAAPPPPRPVDQHSTQPDLPQLYDTLQAAKEQQQLQRQQKSPSPPAATPAETSRTCPRCGTTLTTPSAYCPRCGTALNTPPSRSMPSSDTHSGGPSGHIASGGIASSTGDIAAEQTLLIQRPSFQATLAEKQPASSSHTLQPAQSPRTPGPISTPLPSSSLRQAGGNGTFTPAPPSTPGPLLLSSHRQASATPFQGPSQGKQIQQGQSLTPDPQSNQPSTSSLHASGMRLKVLIALLAIMLVFLLVVAVVAVQQLLHH